MLERLGFEVAAAADGVSGLELLGRVGSRARVVLLDRTMPGATGDELLEDVCKAAPSARVILISGYSGEEIEGHFGATALAGFLQKPFGLGDLQQLLGSLFGARDVEEPASRLPS
jgi:CheY-like chemotaxis protein